MSFAIVDDYLIAVVFSCATEFPSADDAAFRPTEDSEFLSVLYAEGRNRISSSK